MSEIKSFPNNQDVYIGAEDVMKWLHGRTSGVFGAENNASVAAAVNEMAVTVSDGLGWITDADNNGIVWWNDNEATASTKLKINIDAADSMLDRIDRIIVEWRTTSYVDLPEIKVLKGSVAVSPTAPSLTNNGTVRQISLARVYVAAGTTAITASMITDERLDPSVCGIVTESVSVDTSVANAQFNEFLERIQKNLMQILANQIPDGSITREKIAADAIHTTASVTLAASGWANNTQTVSVNDVTAENLVLVAPAPESIDAYSEANIRCIAQGTGNLAFKCDSVPSVDIQVNVTCFVDGGSGGGGGSGGNGGSGGLSITDDGEGNVTITSSGSVSITDDGNGNVVIA